MSSLALMPRAVLKEHRGELLRVLKSFGVKRAGVFGSVARGSDRVGSDIDLIVEFEPDAKRDLIRLSVSLSETVGIPVDVVDAEQVFKRASTTGVGTTILRDTVPL